MTLNAIVLFPCGDCLRAALLMIFCYQLFFVVGKLSAVFPNAIDNCWQVIKFRWKKQLEDIRLFYN